MGAWIEIILIGDLVLYYLVAPHMGAWIEIAISKMAEYCIPSLPTWERGLKSRL